MNEEEGTEKGVISVTPESSKPKERRNLTGKANTTASPSHSNSDGIPHYLRASTGSCHDFCKYGRKHDSEAKKRHPILPTFLANNRTTNDGYNQAKVPVLGERRKKAEIKLKQPKNEVFNGPEVIKNKDLSPVHDIPSTRSDESSEDMLSITSIEHTPDSQTGGSSEEPVSIKLMIPSETYIATDEHGPANQAGAVEEEITMPLGTPPSPTRKSAVYAVPLTCGTSEYTFASSIEGSIEEPLNRELMTSSPFQKSVASPLHSLANQAKRSSKKPTSMKVKTSRSIQGSVVSADNSFAHLAEGSTDGSISKTPQNRLPVQKSIAPSKCAPSSHAGKVSKESVNSKLKSPSLVQKSNQTVERTPGSRYKVIKQKNIDVSEQPNLIKRKTQSSFKKTITSVLPKLTEQNSPSSVKKTIGSRTPLIIKQKPSSPSKGIHVSAKPAISLKSKTAVVKSTSPAISSGGRTDQRNRESRIIRSSNMSQTGDKKILRTPKASLSPNPVNKDLSMKLRKYKNTGTASSLKSQAKAANREHDTEIVKEKTLYVIEPEQENIALKHLRQKSKKYNSSLSSRSSSCSSSSSSPSVSSHGRYKQNDSDSAFSEASGSNSKNKGRNKKVADVSKVDKKQRLRRTTTVDLEDKAPSPHKLKFRRGKIVNLQPENNGPRRLRFRPTRAVSDTQNEVVKSNFRRRKESSGVDLTPPSLEAPGVVLRHQDVQDKKDTQGLFNLVIEETASKLVETRKSKVKALVGAFETVISLQETK